MAVTIITGYTPVVGINYTVTTSGTTDWSGVTNSTYFYDFVDKLVHYKDSSGAILEIFSSSGSTSNATNFTGGTVSGSTNFLNGLTATTISATTYYNLPQDVYVTGGTYTAGTATFTNNTGGTFSISGFSTGATSTGICGIANSSGVYTYYSTLSAALTASVSGQTIELFTDITETGSVAITLKTGVNINGNGHIYTLSVNDTTNAFNGTSVIMEFYNLKVVRSGRALGTSTGFALNLDSSTVRFYGSTFVNTFGTCVKTVNCYIYGLNSYGYWEGINDTAGSTRLYDSICESTGTSIGIYLPTGYVYNSTGKAISNSGIYCNGEIYESIGISTSGVGIEGQRITNSTGISTSGTGLFGAGRNCVGISTSGVAGSGTFYSSTLISSSNYALSSSGTVYLFNSYAESTSSPVTARANIYNSTVICLWNNAAGSCTNSFALNTHEILNSTLWVTNASAYCITGYAGSTWKYANNSFKGATTPINITNITQGITNTSDNQGNILI